MSVLLINGNALSIPLADKSVHCVVTSPPYYGLRDYGTAEWLGGDPDCDHKKAFKPRSERPNLTGSGIGKGGAYFDAQENAVYRDVCAKCGAERVDNQIGLEETPEEYVESMVRVFREIWRVLRDDGTCWLNIGDSYATSPCGSTTWGSGVGANKHYESKKIHQKTKKTYPGLKQKDLIGIPWRLAFALQADGWYLRSDIIWAKANPMPESVTDRPTKSHEYLFLLTKKAQYFYDADAIREDGSPETPKRLLRGVGTNHKNVNGAPGQPPHSMNQPRINAKYSFARNVNESPPPGQPSQHRADREDVEYSGTRNRRTVWNIATPTARLRRDLTPEQRSYVIGELVKRGIL